MSGHSKWANIKHKKEKSDSQKAKAFTKVTREIIISTKAGGGDPETNFRLRMAIQKAKEVNMPNDNINRAIKRGIGENEGDQLEEIIYEGYGSGGVAFLVETLSDNRNRTASDMRYIFSRNNGNLGESGCVSWMFEQKGIIRISKVDLIISEEELFELSIEAGAENIKEEEYFFEIITEPLKYEHIRNFLQDKIDIQTSDLSFIPKNIIQVSGEVVEQVIELFEALEEHDDVQSVYANFEIVD